MTAIGGAGRRSQRAHEQRLRLPVQPNFAVGEAADSQVRQERVWQIPNSYGVCHVHRRKGWQRRINGELKDLVLKGTPGNVVGTAETPKLNLTRRYYTTGKLAAQAPPLVQSGDHYWRRHQTQNHR